MRSHPTIREVAENFEEYIGRVVNEGERFVLMKDRKPVAELRPLEGKSLRLRDLPELFASLPHLDPEDALRFEADLDQAREELGRLPPRDAWES